MVTPVSLVAISQTDGSISPAASVGTTGQGAIGVDELVVGIGFPVRRFTAASNNDAGSVRWLSTFGFHSGRQMHQCRHRTEYTLRVMD
jgi:hypothetical protein